MKSASAQALSMQRAPARPPGLRPAAGPRPEEAQRLLCIDGARDTLTDHPWTQLSRFARPGDVWILNDAATLPASLHGRVARPLRRAGKDVELRLLGSQGDSARSRFRAVLFGPGSWREDTDRRPAPPRLAPGDMMECGEGLVAHVEEVDARSSRLLTVRFEPAGDGFWNALYRLGRPIQYRYLARALRLEEVQTAYAGLPWAVELPSAGRPLRGASLASLRRAGAELAFLTHAAGLSATGDPALDARLPLPERYAIPERTVALVQQAKRAGKRIVAVGTSVTRALEGAFLARGSLLPGEGETDLVIGPSTRLQVVDALLTGAHDPGSSHYALLSAFCPPALLERAVQVSARLGYLGHEFGDSWLILPVRG